MEWLQGNAALLFAVLFGISEVLAQIPAVKANSIFQLVMGFLKTMKDLFSPK